MEFYAAVLVLQFLVSLGVTLLLYMRKPGIEAAAALERMKTDFHSALESIRTTFEQRLRSQDLELTEIKTHMEHTPSSEELRELEGTVKAIASAQEGISRTVQTVCHSTERIETFLLNNRGRA